MFRKWICSSPPGNERIIHPRTEVEQSEIEGAIVPAVRSKGVGHEESKPLLLFPGVTPAVLPGHGGEGRVIDSRAVRQVITLLQDLRYRLTSRDVDHRADVAQMVPGIPAVERVGHVEEDPSFVPSLSQAYFKELPCIAALSTKLRRFHLNCKPHWGRAYLIPAYKSRFVWIFEELKKVRGAL